ncbi:MAG: DUF393 domain-containing protein, partial [Chloroflexi bacterium]|nr:DUF393 domain-containing protein [Chloroflexota bacterium]MCI0726521.1 DUF393 domain-containing protein [Chloroflexota bacterium]
GRVDARPWQRIPERMNSLGLTAEDGMAQVWFVDAAGRLSGGAAAVNEALRLVWWARPLTWLYHLPGVPRLEDRLYRWIAANRNHLPGGTAACRIEPAADQVKHYSGEDMPATGK